MRDIIANIIDPHSFLPDNSGDDLIAEMVRQGKQDALRKADRVIAAITTPSPGLPEEPKRSPLDGREMKFGYCHQCGTRQNLGRTGDDTFICGSCSDANYLAEWIDYARGLRRSIAPSPAPNAEGRS